MKTLRALMIAPAFAAVAGLAPSRGIACAHSDVKSVLGSRIERCWTTYGSEWRVDARAYYNNGEYICSRQYTYRGDPGDAEDLSWLILRVRS